MNLHVKINTKGRDEQEKQYLFPGLYGQKALHKNEIGAWLQMEKYLKNKHKVDLKLRVY